ncbi:MAG: cytochrome c [Candidatus Competibacteraceae bacterium]|nr:cytochrome c [Candidatus Competibacteraceae bacterium]
MKKINRNIVIGLAAMSLLLTSCYKDKNSPGFEFMPDMYRSPAYRPGESNPNFANGLNNQNPVEGTIAHSFDREQMINSLPYAYANTPQGRDSAIAFLKNPLEKSDVATLEGKRLYNVYCAVCHGADGKGDGSVVAVLIAKENYGLQPPAFNSDRLKDITEGQIFHATQYGKGNMGSYSSQLTAYERWQVVMYVQELQRK